MACGDPTTGAGRDLSDTSGVCEGELSGGMGDMGYEIRDMIQGHGVWSFSFWLSLLMLWRLIHSIYKGVRISSVASCVLDLLLLYSICVERSHTRDPIYQTTCRLVRAELKLEAVPSLSSRQTCSSILVETSLLSKGRKTMQSIHSDT